VSRAWRFLVALLGAQAALSAAAVALDWTYACGACRAGGFSLGIVGFAFYTGLFLAALTAGATRFLFAALLFGFGVHLMLVVQLLTLGTPCWICFAAAANSAALASLSVACDRANLTRMALVLPWSVLLVVGWTGMPRPAVTAGAVVTDTAEVRMTVFTQPDCPYCDELRDRILPDIEREFGPRLQVVFRDADALPGLRRTPTLVLSPGRRERSARVIEGLPAAAELRRAILELEREP
jgi:hypothetical protein